MAVTLTTAKLFPSDNQLKLTQDTRVSNPENVYSVNNVYSTSTTDLTKNQNSDRITYKDFSSASVNTDCTIVSLDIFVMMRSTTVAGRDGVILQPKISGIGNGSLGTVVTTTTNSNVWLEALPSGDGYWGFAPANLTVSNLQSSNFVIFSSLINSAYFGNTNVLVDAISYSYQYEMHLNSSVIGAVATSASSFWTGRARPTTTQSAARSQTACSLGTPTRPVLASVMSGASPASTRRRTAALHACPDRRSSSRPLADSRLAAASPTARTAASSRITRPKPATSAPHRGDSRSGSVAASTPTHSARPARRTASKARALSRVAAAAPTASAASRSRRATFARP